MGTQSVSGWDGSTGAVHPRVVRTLVARRQTAADRGFYIGGHGVSIGLGFNALWLDRYRTGLMQAGERYEWSGWYYGLVPVAYWLFLIPCLAAILFLTLRTLWRLFVSGIRRGTMLVRP